VPDPIKRFRSVKENRIYRADAIIVMPCYLFQQKHTHACTMIMFKPKLVATCTEVRFYFTQDKFLKKLIIVSMHAFDIKP